MDFYWEEIMEHSYVLYLNGNAYPLLELYWCEDCECYHCKSETFNFYEDYDCCDLEIDDEKDLLNIVQHDLIESLKNEIDCILEIIYGINKIGR